MGIILSFGVWATTQIFAVKEAQAVMETKQVVNDRNNEVVYAMSITLVRIDENLKVVKENQAKAYGIFNSNSERNVNEN